MAIKVGDIAVVRTTGEPVFVQSIMQREAKEGLSGVQVSVRRPVETREDGVVHREDYFYIEELETESDRRDRTFKQFVDMSNSQGAINGSQESLSSLN